MIIVKGKHSVLEALQSDTKVFEIIIVKTASTSALSSIIHLAKQQKVPIKMMDKFSFEKTLDLAAHQQIAAKIAGIPFRELKSITENPNDNPIVVALDHIEDPYNFGAIMRTCEGLGIKTIIFPKNRSAPLSSGVIKASSGAAYHLNLIQVSNVAQAIRQCESAGYWIVAADSNKGEDIATFSPPFPLVLVVGNEHKGVSKIISKNVQSCIKIPMKGSIDSLNVSVATGITLHTFVQHLK